MKIQFQVYPVIESEEERDFVLLGLAWTLRPFFDRIELYVSVAQHLELEPQLPEGVSRECLALLAEAPFVLNGEAPEPEFTHALCFRSDAAVPPWVLSRTDFDRHTVSHHLWPLQKFLLQLFGATDGSDLGAPKNLTRLRELATRRAQRAYLFGSGPSLETLHSFQLEKGVRIIVNGVALNDQANELIRPDIVCAIDPLQHSSMSGYAAHFTAKVKALIDRYGTTLVTRAEFLPWYRGHLPDEHVVGLDFRFDRAFSSDLDHNDWLSNQNGNVLCAAALPVAAYLADEVALLGFDGRDPEPKSGDQDVRYFWRHDRASTIADWERLVPSVNPAVFARDFDAYRDNHAQVVREIISKLQSDGKSIYRMAPSFVAPIAGLQELKCRRKADAGAG